ncbi:hypothetical protein RF679_13495 [Undibacterium cyanobacteriorum]|uniref:DUF1842 domain-containing protein n=1 Tax=Undibacterium cyanobacteriorum TaxID=3073561 RepID=A0ABY9RHA1_9BURK|nr:hypothetical protein [Undibacterium sp. 20NA77.5]WMW79660.1 hypothetical protein RF679_13495 [Undibacterium sp. 20NA77.5]
MRSIYFIPALFLSGLCNISAAQNPDINFDDSTFVFQSASKETSFGTTSIRQMYAAESPSRHACSVQVTQKTGSTVQGVLSVDRMVMVPALTVIPFEITANPEKSANEDAVSIGAMKNIKDSSKYTVILHRATLMANGTLRDILIQCNDFKYEGVWTKTAAQFEALRSDWTRALFKLDPKLSSDSEAKPKQ